MLWFVSLCASGLLVGNLQLRFGCLVICLWAWRLIWIV